MTARRAALLVALALGMAPLPALAQTWNDGPPPLPSVGAGETWQGEWDGAWEDEETWRGVWHGTYIGFDGVPVEAEYRGTFIGRSRFVSEDGPVLYRDEERGWREERRVRPGPWGRGASPERNRRHGYSDAERAAWLDECEANYHAWDAEAERRGARRGAAIGGVVGAIGGGIVGNRIAGRGNRLGGTLIGAGVGGLAGAAVGSAIGEADVREGAERWETYCEDYLEDYERGASGGYAAGAGHHYLGHGPVMWVRVPIIREKARDCGCEEVIEEEVITRPVRRAAPKKADKRIRYAK